MSWNPLSSVSEGHAGPNTSVTAIPIEGGNIALFLADAGVSAWISADSVGKPSYSGGISVAASRVGSSSERNYRSGRQKKETIMHKLRFFFAFALSVCLLVGAQQPASAAGGSTATITLRVTNATIPWLFPAPEGLTHKCPEIPEGVNINPDDQGSNRNKRAVVNTTPDGAKHIVLTDNVNGTAHDNSGNTYKFVYYNKANLDFDGKTVTVRMQDAFTLKGGSVDYNVGFDWRWAYPATGITATLTTQDITLDPFPFVTPDGVKEDPNIVPGSWEKVSTRGEVVACDPL